MVWGYYCYRLLNISQGRPGLNLPARAGPVVLLLLPPHPSGSLPEGPPGFLTAQNSFENESSSCPTPLLDRSDPAVLLLLPPYSFELPCREPPAAETSCAICYSSYSRYLLDLGALEKLLQLPPHLHGSLLNVGSVSKPLKPNLKFIIQVVQSPCLIRVVWGCCCYCLGIRLDSFLKVPQVFQRFEIDCSSRPWYPLGPGFLAV